jgi:hypothetical protein
MNTEETPKKRKVVVKRTKAAAADATAPENTIVSAEVPIAPEKSDEKKPQCPICIEPYNKVANTQIKCCFCDKDACRRCIQTFLTASTNDPHCMHCNKLWEREFIDDNLTITYRMNDYKKHRENILLDREIALMPATQHRAQQIREAEKLERELLPPFDAQLKALYAESSELTRKINAVYALKNDAQYNIRLLRTGQGKKEKVEVNFIRKCPDGDCRGFLSTAWKCGLCSKWACPDCHEIKGENRDAEHTCKPENVATAKLLAKDSRPCPGCATLITKIEGCDQMWCPQCHTPFSWRTGQKETGVVHNPHFYEWQRKMNNGVAPRALGDVACGGIPTFHDVRARLTGFSPKEQDTTLNFHRLISHTHHVEMAQYHNVFNEADNQDLRIQYILGNITAEVLKTTVQQREKKREKERAMRRALELLVQGGTDLLRRIMAEADLDNKRKILEEIDTLRIYVNELLEKVYDRLKLSVPQYTSSWHTKYPFSPTAKRAEKAKAQADAAKAQAVAAVRDRLLAAVEAATAATTADPTNPEAIGNQRAAMAALAAVATTNTRDAYN